MAIKWAPATAEELARRGLGMQRARESNGTFRADDPATPEVNEAWEAAPAPKRRTRKAKE
jgi:hypothetical protein